MKKAVFREKNRLFAPLNYIGLCNTPPSIGLRRDPKWVLFPEGVLLWG